MHNKEFKGLKDLIGSRYIWFGISAIIIGVGLFSLIPNKGFNKGVDFTGGVLLQYPTNRAVTTSEVEAIVGQVGIKHNPVQVVSDKDGTEFLLRTVGCDQKTDPKCEKFSNKIRDLKIRFRLAFTGMKSPAVELKYLEKPVSKSEVESFIAGAGGLGGATVQDVKSLANARSENEPETYDAVITLSGINDQAAYEKAAMEIYNKFGGYETSAQKGETEVSPLFGEELFRRAGLALLMATIGILIYITVRFEFWFAIAAICALLHDVALTLGFFALFKIEINASFVAVILTVFGYSINDTIIIFDRIRENMRKDKRMPWQQLMNVSLWETMTRSVYTVLTVEIMILAIIFLGGESLRNFSVGLFIGVTTGCYSSIFIAAPLAFIFKTMGGKKEREEGYVPGQAKKKLPQQKVARPAQAAQPRTKAELKAASDAASKAKQTADAAASSGDGSSEKPSTGGAASKKTKGKQRRR